jgi:tRNA(Ile)-lysidine synthase
VATTGSPTTALDDSRGRPISAAEAVALFADLASLPVLLLAVSGGPDSTALMVLAAGWRKRRRHGPRLLAVTIDHGLRPGSAAEAGAVKRLAVALGVAHRTMRWTGQKPVTGLQAAARQARYRLLAGAARTTGASHVLTAHTRDDQAETVLFRLARGSGLSGLAGMARRTPLPGDGVLTLVRPFLGIEKSRLLATLRAAGIPHVEDPSNADPRFTRARLRKIMPLIAAEGLDSGKLALLARRVARAEAAHESAVADAVQRVSLTEWSNSGPILLDRRRFGTLPAEVALRLLGRAIGQVGDEGPVELGKLETLFDAIQDGRAGRSRARERLRRTLAGALVTADRHALRIERAPPRQGRLRQNRLPNSRQWQRRPRTSDSPA